MAWVSLGDGPTYHVPSYGANLSTIVFAAVIGPIAGLAAVAWVRTVARPTGCARAPGAGSSRRSSCSAGAGGGVDPLSQLLGNGLDIVQLTAVGAVSAGLLAILLVLKPIATAACLGSGAPGGLFTPTLTLGVLLAGLAGAGWSLLWPGTPAGAYALIGGAALLAAAMQGPLSAVVIALELTRHADALMVSTLLAVTEATILARRMGAPSIYSARRAPTAPHGRARRRRARSPSTPLTTSHR